MEAYLIFQSCALSLSSDIWCNHTEGYRCHPTSNIRHRTSDIRDPTSDIPHLTSEIRHPTSDIRDSTSDIRHPRSDIRHPTSEIRHLTSEIWHPRSEIRRLTFERMALMCSAWDEGTYEVRFERKQCRLFCFFFFFILLSFCIVQNAYYPGMLLHWETCSEVVSFSGLYGEFKPFALAHLILGL